MPPSSAVYRKNENNLVLNDLIFANPLPTGKCIELRNCNDLKSFGCKATNFAKRFMDLRQLRGADIGFFTADASFNATQDFCIGISIGASGVDADACHDIHIHDGKILNVRYGGGSSYKNGDGIAIEKKCTNIMLERLVIEDVQDGGIDSKSPFTLHDSTINKAKRGIRIWEGLADLKNVTIENCGEDIWLGGPLAKVRLNNVVNPNGKLKIVTDDGPVAEGDPRVEYVYADPTPVPTPTDPELTKLIKRVELLEFKLAALNDLTGVKETIEQIQNKIANINNWTITKK